MNLETMFSGHSPQSHTEENKFREMFTDEQLQLLEERRASDWLHSHIAESVTPESKEHDIHLSEKMLLLELTAEDYAFFIQNYAKFGVANKNTLH